MSNLRRLAKLRQTRRGTDLEKYSLEELRQNWLAIEDAFRRTGKDISSLQTTVSGLPTAVVSESSGSFSDSSGSIVPVTNLSCQITVTIGRVFVTLYPGSAGASYVGTFNNAGNSATAGFFILRDNVIISRYNIQSSAGGSTTSTDRVPPPSIQIVDDVAPGTYTYSISAISSTGVVVENCKLKVFEM